MIDFIYENLLPNAVKGVHLTVKVEVKMKVEVKGVHLKLNSKMKVEVKGVHLKVKVEAKMKVKSEHLNINGDVRVIFSGHSLGGIDTRCGCGGFVTSKALVLVFNQPYL